MTNITASPAGKSFDLQAHAEVVPFSLPSIEDDDIEAVTATLRSRWLTTGGQSLEFERELAGYLGVQHAVAVASCTHALEICLHYLGLPAGSRVGVPDWTFVSTALSAIHAGYQPVLIDIEAHTLNLSPAALDAALDHGLDAVVGVHFGGSALSEDVHRLCADHSVPLIEDAAHALGASDGNGLINGRRSVGACFSFYATKNLTSGEGGAITTQDADLADFARTFRLHGMSRDAWKRYLPGDSVLYDVNSAGIKANFPDILAALARSQLRRFPRLQACRRRLVSRYRHNLEQVRGLDLVPPQADSGSADHLMVVLLPPGTPRPDVVAELRRVGISTSVHFQPLHLFRGMDKHFALGPTGVETAGRLAQRALSLPLYPDLTDDQVDRVCDALALAVLRHAP
jgi:dTDP-4-amino-4,6-dideoxygalactose transaminase